MILYDNFFLGADSRCIVSTNSAETQLNNNVIVVGGSGSGKTYSVLLPTLLHMEYSNAIGIFTKRHAMNIAKNVLENRGYNVYIIDFANPDKNLSGYGYDPMKFCKNDSDISDLAHSIINSAPTNDNTNFSDPYWNDSAENLLNLTLKYVFNGHYSGGKSVSDALELLDTLYIYDKDIMLLPEDKPFEPPLIFKEFANDKLKNIDPVGYAYWRCFENLKSEVTASCIVSSLHTPLQKIFSDDVRKIIRCKKHFDLKNLLNPHSVLFLYLSPVSLAQHRLVGIFYQQVFNKLFQIAESCSNGFLPYPVHIFCDDFATGCKIPNFPMLISIFREKRISATILLQSESQLVSLYGSNDSASIISNCDSYVFLGSMDWDNCANIARRLNLPANDVANMPVGREIFIRRGQKPFITSRYNLFQDPVFLKADKKSKSKVFSI